MLEEVEASSILLKLEKYLQRGWRIGMVFRDVGVEKAGIHARSEGPSIMLDCRVSIPGNPPNLQFHAQNLSELIQMLEEEDEGELELVHSDDRRRRRGESPC